MRSAAYSFFSSIALFYWVIWVLPSGVAPVFYGSYYWGTAGGYSLLAIWAVVNFGAAILLNKARKHWRNEAFDDRLTDETMNVALEYWIRTHRYRRPPSNERP